MNHYEHNLKAMLQLFKAVGFQYWADWIRKDIELWQRNSDTSHHLSAYGGMGTINDILILKRNGHEVSEKQEPWVNSLFRWLKTISYSLAKQPNNKLTKELLSENIGSKDVALMVFAGGINTPDVAMRGFANLNLILAGWRCRCCGYSNVAPYDVEVFMANALLPYMVFHACESFVLDGLVDETLKLKIPNVHSIREALQKAIKSNKITLINRKGPMWLCPKCKKDDANMCYWQLVQGKQVCLKRTNY